MGINWPLIMQGGFFAALLAAACFWDIRKRIIPDSLCLCIALTGLLAFEPVKLWGILAALPFLMAALAWGGMGGGDIKLMATAGLVLGIHKSTAAIIIGLSVLLAFHAIHILIQRVRKKEVIKAYPLAPFLSFGCLAAYFIL
ncbi:A24 family peptidase [Clostridium sp. BNL1100]|uniref:prepilin peptidase n=1 Tax=Clostridium sp. BNL1100 TaxID=755731 RepID=UPI00024A7FAD|nr:A24 family peptidase [Clostridium sp. BNL1100]AEY67583.1 type IV leader peptidase [Clostridium sp. BNL1100]